MFGANIPLEDDIKYQLCHLAYKNFLLKHKDKKEKEKEKETSGIEEENNPCRRSACLAAKRGIRDLNNVCLLEVPCCEDKVEESNAFASLMLQEESEQLEELLENNLDGGDKLDEEVNVKEEEEDVVDVVGDKQRTDEIQNKEGNKDEDNVQWNEKTTDGKQNERSNEERNDLDGGDELDEEVDVKVKEEEEDAIDIVEDEQRTDEIQNGEGNKEGNNE